MSFAETEEARERLWLYLFASFPLPRPVQR